MNLLAQIQLGESKILELKSELPQHDQIAKTIVSFANTSGGKLVLGVDDQRQVVGLNEDDTLALQDRITAIILTAAIRLSCQKFIVPTYKANWCWL
jgi:ATP-dependent DNA helicase RecG